jgi:hypothetical protein
LLLPRVSLSLTLLPDETQRAINDANFILTYLPPLNGEVQSVKIDGSQNNDAGTLRFAGAAGWQVTSGQNPLIPRMTPR